MTALIQMIMGLVPLLGRGLALLPALWQFISSFRWVTHLVSGGFFYVALPLAFNWAFFKIAQLLVQPLLLSLDLSPQILSLTGNGAWLANQLQIPFALSVLLGFALQSLIMRLTAVGGMFSKVTR
jgi:hypothetical protein